MLVSEIVTRVQRQFGDEAGMQITSADIIRWINDAQREIAVNNTLLQVKATTSSIVGTTNYAVPVGLLSLHTIRYNGIKLKQINLQQADDLIPPGVAVPNGTPEYFYREAGNFVLYPAPSTAINAGISILYTRVPVDVTAVGDTPELPLQYHNRIVEYCIAQAAELDDNLQLAAMKMQQFEGKTADIKDAAEAGSDYYPTITASPSDYGFESISYMYDS